MKLLRAILERLQKFGLQLNFVKYGFDLPEVNFLGFTINENGFKPLKDKVNLIVEYLHPKTFEELQRFLINLKMLDFNGDAKLSQGMHPSCCPFTIAFK